VAGVSEFFAGELALVLNRGRGTAHHLHHRAQVWRDSLPATHGALAAGQLDLARAAVLADVLGGTSPEPARQVEARLLPDAGGPVGGPAARPRAGAAARALSDGLCKSSWSESGASASVGSTL
jgi:hypothetical protein